MSSFVHGIATAQMIDSSGEIVDIKGHDISSLDKTGTINYEHHAAIPAQVVGKILKAKKIYKVADCEDDYQRKFWETVKVPFVYIMAELFDDYCDSAKDAAGKLKYSYDRPHLHGVYGFSVEGASIPGTKEGVTIKRSIARKVSLTDNPANKTCLAEWMPPQESKVKDDFDSIFKTEQNTIELFKSGKAIEMYQEFLAKKEDDMKKAMTLSKPAIPPQAGAPNAFGTRTANPGTHMGATTSGKPVFSHTHVHGYQGFSAQDHKDAAGIHAKAAETTKGDPKLADHHVQKMKLHNAAAATATSKEGRLGRGMAAKRSAALNHVTKSLTAGNGDAAPSSLVDGAAYQKENLGKKKWSKRAKEEYENWEHKGTFEKFMKSQMPNLAEGEIKAIGQVVALQKSVNLENALVKALKFGSTEDQAKTAAALEERKKNPPKKAKPYVKAPDLKHPVDSEVSAVKPDGEKHDIVHLASGHELHGHPRGKFKVGDKVHAKPHLMGTHLLEHKK